MVKINLLASKVSQLMFEI